MSVYFNDINTYTNTWLTNIFPNAIIDGRSIIELDASIGIHRRVHLFAGIGGWEYALGLAGWPKNLSVWTGSCPCQPFSQAGLQKGESDERHLWPEFKRLIFDCKPSVIFGEQVSSKLGYRWLARVRYELEERGYGVGAANLSAASIGAPHKRQRLFWVAYSGSKDVQRYIHERESVRSVKRKTSTKYGDASIFERVHHGPTTVPALLPDGVSRPVGAVHAFGNSIVPQVAAVFIRSFMEAL